MWKKKALTNPSQNLTIVECEFLKKKITIVSFNEKDNWGSESEWASKPSKPFVEVTEPRVKSNFHGILVLGGTSKVLRSIFLASAESTRREAVTILSNTLKHKENCLIRLFLLMVDEDIDLTFFYFEKCELRQTRMNQTGPTAFVPCFFSFQKLSWK